MINQSSDYLKGLRYATIVKYTQYIEINGHVHKFNKIISKNVYKILLYMFHIVGFCPLFMLWDYVLWDFVLWDFVRRDFVLWDSVPDSQRRHIACSMAPVRVEVG